MFNFLQCSILCKFLCSFRKYVNYFKSQTYLRKRVFIQAIKLAVLISESELLFYTIYIRGVLLLYYTNNLCCVEQFRYCLLLCQIITLCIVQPDFVNE